MVSMIASLIAAAGLVAAQDFNAGDGFVSTVTTFTTQEITVTSCAPDVTVCPGRVITTMVPVVTTLPATVAAPVVTSTPVCAGNCPVTTLAAVVVVPTGATGTAGAGACVGCPGGSTYNMPNPTGGYTGPSFEGAANKFTAGGAVAAIGAAAAFFL